MTVLSYAGLSALLGCLPAAGLFFLVSQAPMDLLTVWAGSFLIFFFIFDVNNRAQNQRQLTETLEKIRKAQSQVEAKLTHLEKTPREETPSENIVEELRVLQDLIQRMAEQEMDHEDVLLERASETVSVHVIHEKASPTDEEEKIEFRELSRGQLLSIIEGALREDRIEMLLQPIVSLPQRKTRAFECYSRLRDEKGTIIIPDHYLGEKDLIRIIDNTLLLRCVQLIRKASKKRVSAPFFCNLFDLKGNIINPFSNNLRRSHLPMLISEGNGKVSWVSDDNAGFSNSLRHAASGSLLANLAQPLFNVGISLYFLMLIFNFLM